MRDGKRVHPPGCLKRREDTHSSRCRRGNGRTSSARDILVRPFLLMWGLSPSRCLLSSPRRATEALSPAPGGHMVPAPKPKRSSYSAVLMVPCG
ncbi:hypothetical protein AAFF_G00434900 [Aldrovandia affinis]|uniref:Uncharacterized protein n=1 Tax=Aldrovandia affinis TaxID=143900 RepID=A0AAD7S865_9TELE|nr:hypothetical protein AAFF_G00434900 [Aldrovandia affinis]